jgi:phospholipid-binding lipoprotein MlaA
MEKRRRRNAVDGIVDLRKFDTVAHGLLGIVLLGGCATGNDPSLTAFVDSRHYAAASTTQTDVEPTVIEPTVVGYRAPRDPLMPVNRAIFAFNDVAYRYALIPLSRGYQGAVPQPVRTGIGNFFSNLRAPISLINHLLQGKPGSAGRQLARFGINSTVGLLGLFDPATSWFDIEPEKTTFEDTLTRYGTGQGVFLVLPLIGPSDTRNGAGLVVDYFLNPVHYLTDDNEERAARGLGTFQQFAPTADEYAKIRKKADDPYVFFRNLYWQGVRHDAEY